MVCLMSNHMILTDACTVVTCSSGLIMKYPILAMSLSICPWVNTTLCVVIGD